MASHANRLAAMLKKGFIQKGYSFLVNSTTNQQFVIMPDRVLDKLRLNYTYSYCERIDETHSAVRFCTSWATKEEDIEQFLNDLYQIG